MSVLRNLGPALRLFFRQAGRHLAEPIVHVPPFPLRCQHCNKSIRFALGMRGSTYPLFVDPEGHILCDTDPESRLLHRPMPSVLG
jgi:hypothetical protein